MTAYYIVLDDEDPGFDPGVDGTAISKAVEFLDELAKKHRLRCVNDYVSISPEEAEGLLEDVGDDGNPPPPEEFFEADEGMRWVTALSALVQKSTRKDKAAILADLGDYRDVFAKAREAGVRWHLAVDC